MTRYLLLAAAFLAGLIASAATAKAQFDCEFPGLGGGGLLEWNLRRDAMADQQARDFCQQWYNQRQEFRRQTGYYGYLPPPVTTQQLVDSNRALQDQYSRNNQNWAERSAREGAAVERFSQQAIRGIAPYYNPQTGFQAELPYGPNQYHIDQYHYAHPGYNPQGFNVQPYYGY